MDRLEAMSLFIGAVEAGSLSAAARNLGIPLATVSRKISDLERHLNTRLLNRSTRRLTLTDAGHAYLAACRRILDDVGEAERTAAGEYSVPTGELVITAPVVFGRLHVLPVVTAFLAAYPDVDIRLTLADRITQLAEDHIDLAVRIGALPDSSLVALRVGAIRRVVCASPAYLAERGTPQTPEDLATHSCITFEGPGGLSAWSFASGKAEISIRVRSRLQVNTAEAAIDAAIAGVGPTRVLSYQVEAAVRSGALRILLREFEPEPWPVNLVHAGQGLLPVKLRAFLDFAAPRLRDRLARLA
ncbi:LysR family transcriptional regulator [Mesorhizobium sp. M00.F.Ca.ET.186.01.1.1]|nr:LysR family transcriptional regulator [bacterium M00.F.Ca.ET.205.01.1.1]TGU51784.1 LysR family transcriptional regulator [bacterium M00.F.Ca.ET.152.01.1.1]TGV33183.1 LysR family transcriptional regulator [Mesorhizobium sp. M00.F.Ca.ET.186.01.1.1]TGZ42323.1 LysR family transcriptional regulator [bacterium M00.F.Ca.ET.162.01.1.1]TIW62478.1 MAG: LysR family transcriptional regulator [Mesorhizobium sp.]